MGAARREARAAKTELRKARRAADGDSLKLVQANDRFRERMEAAGYVWDRWRKEWVRGRAV